MHGRLRKEELVVEGLRIGHTKLLAAFSCGKTDEDDFLKHDARQSQGLRLSETYLLFEDEKLERIVSYITIAVGSFQLSKERKLRDIRISDKPFRIFSNHMPCLLIGKLATDVNETNRGGARHLVDFAIDKAVNAMLPIPFVALHTYPEIVGFYDRLGFNIAFNPKGKHAPGLVTMYFELKK